ncbi:hypothetical protein JMN32_22130 [Fulvivirga sp. 29W222]|uniref:Uncharacterized protein n=1 Tax=Fulvivirga marina TaxID=2494733 RepID=A0A937KDD4_9BACT|nr:hypothetical protein [Fulvivirga marina]MBL6449026.1 hypothetical protein [Fulvivirga marina]
MMSKKKLFLLFAMIFFGAMIYVTYDISIRTTFPGSKPQLKERLLHRGEQKKDTIYADSLSKVQFNDD